MSAEQKIHDLVMRDAILTHEPILKLIGDSPVRYVDVPMHCNIGDLLIMKGARHFMVKNKIDVKMYASYFNFNPNWVNDGEIIVFHGGGNLGDLYSGPQQIREATISACLRNRIIILPQTIEFSSNNNYTKCCNIFNTHPDLHIFVRDARSFSLAKGMTKNVYLAADMAHQLWPILSSKINNNGTLGIIRTDDESSVSINDRMFSKITDWPMVVGRRDKFATFIQKFARLMHIMGVDKYMVSGITKIWWWFSDRFISEAIELLLDYEKIETDRLHGHILASLLKRKSCVYDNSYGKNSSYINAWTIKSPLVTLVE